MQRQALDNGNWFDRDAASCFGEETRWDGNNFVSLATGSQWDHQDLYRTKSGRWVLHGWSQWQGSADSWTEIDDTQAARWLVRNEHEAHSACSVEYAALEI